MAWLPFSLQELEGLLILSASLMDKPLVMGVSSSLLVMIKITFILKHCNLLTGSTPVQLEKLESGWHVVKILAVGDDCVERQPLKVNFLV